VIDYYGELRIMHIAAAIASGALFLLRGLLVQANRGAWALAPIPRYLSYAIDTTLLAAALSLFAILPSQAFSNGWLATKLAFLPFYIGLGWGALRAQTRARRLGFFVGAVVMFAAMYGIARAHDPLGPLGPLARQLAG
jgi:uncharacterized membrane protein SirB2